MKAFGLKQDDPQANLELMDVPIPRLDEEEVLVRIQAIGVGLHDRWYLPSKPIYPYVIGIEASGIIEDIGAAVKGYQPGCRVMFTSAMKEKGGVWAEFAAVSQEDLILIPEGLDFVRAAALPVAGITALAAIQSLALNSGDTLFIAGASGAIGTLAIQLAKSLGCRVAASASARNHEYMRSLGAEKTVDYHDPDWQDQLRSWLPDCFDAAMAIQPGTGSDSLAIVKDGGKLVTVSGDRLSSERRVEVSQVMIGPEAKKSLADLAAEVEVGTIHVEVERAYSFEQGLEALEKTETRHARGKVVLTLD